MLKAKVEEEIKPQGLVIGKNGLLKKVNNSQHIKYCIKSMILTRLGERGLYKRFGTNIDRMLFRKKGSGEIQESIHSIKKALTKFEDRINVESVDFESKENFSADGKIVVQYTILDEDLLEVININLDS